MAKLLLCGVPGTGKTTLANYLEAEHGFFHRDMEANEFAARKEFTQDPTGFLKRLTNHKDIVLSWGFRPFKDRATVEELVQADFRLIWLDWDRVVSFRNFMQRENNNPISEATYYEQMQSIITTGIVELLRPQIINPYTATGNFKQLEAIASEILNT